MPVWPRVAWAKYGKAMISSWVVPWPLRRCAATWASRRRPSCFACVRKRIIPPILHTRISLRCSNITNMTHRLPRYGVRAQQVAGRPVPRAERPDGADPSAADSHPDRAWPVRRAFAWRDPPRREACEHHGVRFRRGENHRFRRLLLHQSGADHAGRHGGGTAQYISPEQAQGQHATPQSDIYSLGIVAYEGLCGHRPFTGATPVDIAAAHVNNPVPPLPDSVDVQLREFVMSMLSKDPLDRPKDALTVSRTLSRIERLCSTSRHNWLTRWWCLQAEDFRDAWSADLISP